MSKNFLSNKENITLNTSKLSSKISDQQYHQDPSNKQNIFNPQIEHSDAENDPEF